MCCRRSIHDLINNISTGSSKLHSSLIDYYTQHKLLTAQDGSYTYRRDKTGAALMVITFLA